ncbi:hypothetical protein GCM10010254_22860 [Streptomyces chromofuscus]|nr:hypothetical protein GCM10010254_22860 [Streptomyces chromofuscus]
MCNSGRVVPVLCRPVGSVADVGQQADVRTTHPRAADVRRPWVPAPWQGEPVFPYPCVTPRRLAAATLAAAALAGAGVAAPASAADRDWRSPAVEISSVQYDSPGRDTRSNRSLNGEWVEVTNTTRRGVNLDGWTLSDEDGNTYTFDRFRLAGRATVRIHTGEGRDRGGALYQDRRDHVWDNRSDTATLRNDWGRFIDALSWGGRHHDRNDDGRHGGDRDGRHDRSDSRHHDRNGSGRHDRSDSRHHDRNGSGRHDRSDSRHHDRNGSGRHDRSDSRHHDRGRHGGDRLSGRD